MSPHLLFRVMGIAEAVSWTLLLGGIVLRATAGMDIAVTVGGGIHGFVFLAYAVTAVLVAKNQRMPRWPAAVAVISAVIPYATIPADVWLNRTGRLTGDWRHTPTSDPRDQLWHDRLFRLVLRRPIVSSLVLLTGVAVTFAALVALGSPLERLPD
ncbi:DUF3817 domain-containing protein [Nesterenkonia sphaerica]|uniref:DUF3817 domain-containing protein n=1 Tax=Nesterenkonia sphaerica TaxID=1804988 RepID=A0A5R9A8V7_9MICC|nr:DUF3817 domain-containing protein [Nesterenkonia sphaerica]TLP74216.1 DUF3817 domain-containing protein [Nesterenkonia sphaerica]